MEGGALTILDVKEWRTIGFHHASISVYWSGQSFSGAHFPYPCSVLLRRNQYWSGNAWRFIGDSLVGMIRLVFSLRVL
eukprot:2674265-Amphidinium_carterae.1